MSSINMMYVLPIERCDEKISDETYGARVVELLEGVDQFSRFQSHAPVKMECKDGRVSMWLKYLYEGYDDYYIFHMLLELVTCTDTNRLMLIGHYEHEHNGLFNELIEDKVLPDWAHRLGLKQW